LAALPASALVGVLGGPRATAAPRLLASAPNPAVTGAQIRFFLPRPAGVTLDLYDVRGGKVRTLLRARAFSAGPQHVTLASGLAPGLYLLRLEAEGTVAAGKLVVTR